MSVNVYDRFPNCLVVGEGAVKTIGDHIRKFGEIKRVAVITDQGLKSLPIVTDLIDILRAQGFEVSLFGDVRSLPTDRNVLELVEKMKDFGAEAVVAIGGGSAMDCARAANALYSYGGTLEEHNISRQKYSYSRNVLKPCFAVPTTAGTGCEVAAGCGIIKTDPITGEGVDFYIVSAKQMIPDVSIIDPLMSISLNPATTAATGMDALTHAYESMVSLNDFPLAAGLSLEAIYLVLQNLRAAVTGGGDIRARENMAIAATTATVSFQLCKLGLVHAISEGLSAFALIPHGVANAILLPKVMEFNAPCVPDKMVRVAAAMGINTFELSEQQAAARAVEEVKSLMRDIEMPFTFTEYLNQREKEQPEIFRPISRKAVDMSLKLAMESSFIQTNPRTAAVEDIEAMLDKQFAGYRFSATKALATNSMLTTPS